MHPWTVVGPYQSSDCPIPSLGVAPNARTRYAKCGDADVAYQVLGDGSIDLLLYTGANVPIDCMDEEPSMARFQRQLASFGRLIRFDRRGTGLSERGSASAPPTREQWIQDAVAVLDAVGSAQAAVLAPWLNGPGWHHPGSNAPSARQQAHLCEQQCSLHVGTGLSRWIPRGSH